jgi:hypothetical protein
MKLENTIALSGKPTNDAHWFRSTVNVQVSDGRLTLNNTAGAINNRVCFIDIKTAGIGATEGAVKLNEALNYTSPPPTSKIGTIGGVAVSGPIFSQILI